MASILRMSLRLTLLMWLTWLTLSGVRAQTPTGALTTRDAEGKVQVRRQNVGAYLGAYLGDAGRSRGARVGKVLADSPAAKAGLLENDLLIGLADARIENAAQVYQWLTNSQAHQLVALRVRRNDGERALTVTLGERSARGDDPCQKLFSETNAVLAEAERLKALAEEAGRKGDAKLAEERRKEAETFFKQAEISRLDVETAIAEGRAGSVGRKDGCLPTMLQANTTALGLEVAPLTPQLASYFAVRSGGVLVVEIKAGSLAAQAGLQIGDCLISLNDKAVTTAMELKLVFDMAEKATVSAAIVPAGQTLSLPVARR